MKPIMRDDDIVIHRRPPADARADERARRSVARDDDMVFRRRTRRDSEPPERRDA